ncbi:MAG: peptidase T [Deltaproteobacteria bacterium]|nr:peptidase T [Deltaproteobacteria bacterium]
MKFTDLLARFISYVKIDTQSDPESKSFPSTRTQFDLARKLVSELNEIGLTDVSVNEHGYVSGTLAANQEKKMPVIALIAHMDTSPDVPGKGVRPVIHHDYDGTDISLSQGLMLSVADNPLLKEKRGKTIITSDGTTLLGADDKAGIAEIMSAVNFLVKNPDYPRPGIRVIFTPDEELGRGTDIITVEEIGADYGYTVDGGNLGEIEDETFCADSVEVKIRGINVHPGYAKDRMINAVKIAARIIENLPHEAGYPENTDHREGYIHPHVLTAGVEEAQIHILVRDFEEGALSEKERLISETVEKARADYCGAEISISVKESYRNMKQVLDNHPVVVKKAEQAIKDAGLTPVRKGIRGGTDGSRLSFMGLPTPNLFTGGNNVHSRLEWITLEDMEKAAEVIVRLMKSWAE